MVLRENQLKKNYAGKREDEVVYRWNYPSRGVLTKLFFRSIFTALKEREHIKGVNPPIPPASSLCR